MPVYGFILISMWCYGVFVWMFSDDDKFGDDEDWLSFLCWLVQNG